MKKIVLASLIMFSFSFSTFAYDCSHNDIQQAVESDINNSFNSDDFRIDGMLLVAIDDDVIEYSVFTNVCIAGELFEMIYMVIFSNTAVTSCQMQIVTPVHSLAIGSCQ